jgi:hypothetical protein
VVNLDKIRKYRLLIIVLAIGFMVFMFGIINLASYIEEYNQSEFFFHLLILGSIFFYLVYEIIYLKRGKPIFEDFWNRENKISFKTFLQDNGVLALLGIITYIVVFGVYIGIKKIDVVFSNFIDWFVLFPSRMIGFFVTNKWWFIILGGIVLIILLKYFVWSLFLKNKLIKEV